MKPTDIIGYPFGYGTGLTYQTFNQIVDTLANFKEITYSELVSLRDDGELVPGVIYRITDYVTTTTQDNTQSAEHAFDILVMADSETTLDENAKAVQHSGDTYFSTSNLNSWELKYCLDNDDTRFAWADTENGKGVIYYMKDEWGNECPYDFKNIQFKRWAVTDVTSTKLTTDALSNLQDIFIYNEGSQDIMYAYQGSNISIEASTLVVDSTAHTFYYTFTWVDGNGDVLDASIVGQTLTNDESQYNGVFDNVFGQVSEYDFYPEEPERFRLALGCNVLVSTYSYEDGMFYGIYYNRFGSDCYSNTFGNSVGVNTFGNEVYNNTFGNSVGGNTFGNSIWYNTFGNSVGGNTFGNYIYKSTVGEGVTYCDLPNTATTEGSNQSNVYQYFVVMNGTQGTSSTRKNLTTDEVSSVSLVKGVKYQQNIGFNSTNQLRIKTLMDLIL